MNTWPLLGIGIVVIGFALRFNPLLVVVGAATESPARSRPCFSSVMKINGMMEPT